MRIEFCVLQSQDPLARQLAACQLAAKAWRAGRSVFIRASDPEQCAELDQLLWRFQGECFIPHALAEHEHAPVLIGIDQTPPHEGTVLLNLKLDSRPQLVHCTRLIELVDQEPRRLQLSREHFRHYQSQGYAPKRIAL